MQCPIDGTELMMTERGGVEIDYCPKCRGVWLDRGELDKIIDRAGSEAPRMAPESARPVELPEPRAQAARPEPVRRDDDGYSHARPYRKRREGFLSELFDFD
jgi:Zn-finger nucleic acid-binding protein